MPYGTRPAATHDGVHREVALADHRAQTSYDYRPSASISHHLASHSWHAQPSLTSSKLPPPRHLSNQPAQHPHRDCPSLWTDETDCSAPPARDDYGRQRPLEAGVDPQHAPRSRAYPYAEEPSSPFMQSPSVYARPSDLNSAGKRNASFEHDQSRFASAPSSAYPLASPGIPAGPTRAGSVSHASVPSFPAQSDHFHSDHFQRRAAFHDLEHSRRMSMQPGVHDSSSSSRYVPNTPSASSWQPTYPAGKRPFPSEHEAHFHQSSPALPPRTYPPCSTQLRNDAPLRANAQLPSSPSVVKTHEYERDSPIKHTPSKPTPTRDDVEAPRDSVPLTTGAASVVAKPVATPAAPQHLLQPQRKRLRVSRACDECRRRKTRCDIVGAFPGEPGHPLTISGAVPPLEPNMEPKGEMLILQPCLNCRRSEVTCSYSKRPLKRGPSKGYIKDLERRLNSLESQLVAGERADGEEQGHAQQSTASASSASVDSAPHSAKPKVRTEDRISRLESVLARPSTANKSERIESDKDVSAESTQYSGEEDTAQIESAVCSGTGNINDTAINGGSSARSVSACVGSGSPSILSTTTDVKPSSKASSEITDASGIRRRPHLSKNLKGKGRRRSAISASAGPSDAEVADTKAKIVTSLLHATFPVVPARSAEAESSSSNASTIARIQDRVLARGLRLLNEPAEMITHPHDSHTRPSAPHGSRVASHAARVASLIGQASAGLDSVKNELALQIRPGTDQLRALRKLSHRLACQEADLLMLCHLDHLRNGRNNNSALAAAVAKLGSGSNIQDDRETYRRRTLLFMLDRWHAVAFGTPHLLMGRFGMERHSFQAMKEALGNVSQCALGDGVYEVLRGAIMFGELNDMVQNNGGWKGITKSDVEAVIHSATDENEGAMAASEPLASSSANSVGDSGLLGTAAMRYSLESAVRCYHALHQLPNGVDATVEDVHRVFGMVERILVLGTEKTPISLQGKLLQSAIGPHVLSIAGVGFSWCLRIICMLVAQSQSQSHSASREPQDASTLPKSLMPLEFVRRKMLDYVRMCGPFCLFSGGAPTAAASFAPVYLRLALYFNQTVSFASSLGSLVSPQPDLHSALHQPPSALATEADNVLDMATQIGFLGYLLATTRQSDALQLVAARTPSA